MNKDNIDNLCPLCGSYDVDEKKEWFDFGIKCLFGTLKYICFAALVGVFMDAFLTQFADVAAQDLAAQKIECHFNQ